MKNGFIIAEKYLEDSYEWNTGKAQEIEKKYLEESEEKHPYDLTKPTSKEADRKLLEFIKKYPNQWHSFSKDKATKDSIRKLEKQGTIEVNWKNEQFYYETKEQKDHPQLSNDEAKLIAAQELTQDPNFYK